VNSVMLIKFQFVGNGCAYCFVVSMFYWCMKRMTRRLTTRMYFSFLFPAHRVACAASKTFMQSDPAEKASNCSCFVQTHIVLAVSCEECIPVLCIHHCWRIFWYVTRCLFRHSLLAQNEKAYKVLYWFVSLNMLKFIFKIVYSFCLACESSW